MKAQALSENDHTEQEVKRDNFISLFLDHAAADRFLAAHLYGCIREMDEDLTQNEISLLERSTLADLSTTFARW